MVRGTIDSLLAEPGVAAPPGRTWRDWLLVSTLLVVAIVETVLRDDIAWEPLSFIVCVAFLPGLLWRRTHPLAALAPLSVVLSAFTFATLFVDVGVFGHFTNAYILILIYALFRWGSGRHAAIGLLFVLVTMVASEIADDPSVGDSVGGLLVLGFPAELGAVVRYRTNLRIREVEEVKSAERAQLARELHDTVAHHVSAIAIQAQAGQALASSTPEAAAQVLATIEEEASRTLAEMRAMVGALRSDDSAELAPQRGVNDIEYLSKTSIGGPLVSVKLVGDFAYLNSSVDAALYRLAQESITNAVRHAKNATKVDVCVTAEDDLVRLTVSDDGDMTVASRSMPGYGIIGMAERASLRGGSLTAGPNSDSGRGWIVEADLPRSGVQR